MSTEVTEEELCCSRPFGDFEVCVLLSHYLKKGLSARAAAEEICQVEGEGTVWENRNKMVWAFWRWGFWPCRQATFRQTAKVDRLRHVWCFRRLSNIKHQRFWGYALCWQINYSSESSAAWFCPQKTATRPSWAYPCTGKQKCRSLSQAAQLPTGWSILEADSDFWWEVDLPCQP